MSHDASERAFAALKGEYLWPFDATWVHHRIRAETPALDADQRARLHDRLVDHWRAHVREALPVDLHVEEVERPGAYRDAAGQRDVVIRADPKLAARPRIAAAIGLSILAVAAWVVWAGPTAFPRGLGQLAGGVLSASCCVMPMVLSLLVHAAYRLIRWRSPTRFVRRQARWELGGHGGAVAATTVAIQTDGAESWVVLRSTANGAPWTHVVYRAESRRDARIAAILFAEALR